MRANIELLIRHSRESEIQAFLNSLDSGSR